MYPGGESDPEGYRRLDGEAKPVQRLLEQALHASSASRCLL
jgi:hypothetical protein